MYIFRSYVYQYLPLKYSAFDTQETLPSKAVWYCWQYYFLGNCFGFLLMIRMDSKDSEYISFSVSEIPSLTFSGSFIIVVVAIPISQIDT